MGSKDERPESFTRTARKAQIVACAIEVIAEVGYPQASIRKIADRVGIAMSAVLYHFGSKDNLVDAIVEHMYRTMLALVAPALDAETTATGKLNAYIRSCIEYFGTHRAALLALTSTATNFAPGDGRRFDELGLSPEVAEQLTVLDPMAILAAGQRNGEFGDFPLESTAMAVRGAVNSVVEKILREPGYDARGYGEDLVEIFGRVVSSGQ
ncbi:TetR/AcrR family transcriptional regulator [Mycolicibacterium helvum]|uniref:Putative transcriptional regulator, TetR family protein n=1 Tax=Mycolicibacterium helvum TaxID=1534349 RepID=A0A7I7T2F6_9MYCO|nr:TetR/AcrR family transcriptional regulator [Mycolicibacterium helvum]BBY63447.1 putative transcriptional regulator, TetR family protein [Mycolicibacterium helvum]